MDNEKLKELEKEFETKSEFNRAYTGASENLRGIFAKIILMIREEEICDKTFPTNKPDYRLQSSEKNFCLFKIGKKYIKIQVRTDKQKQLKSSIIDLKCIGKGNHNGKEWFEFKINDELNIDEAVHLIREVSELFGNHSVHDLIEIDKNIDAVNLVQYNTSANTVSDESSLNDINTEEVRNEEMNFNNIDFYKIMQNRIAVTAIGTSALRNQGKGILKIAQEYCKSIDLSNYEAASNKDKFIEMLNKDTENMLNAFELVGKPWGTVRKALNLFLRDCCYNKYLSKKYNLERIQGYLEIPLDSVIAGGLAKIDKDKILPKWTSLKYLTSDISNVYQEFAQSQALKINIDKVHLDMFLWLENR